MIDNQCTEGSTLRNQAGQPIEYPGYIRNIVPHCNPTKKKRKIKTPNVLKDIKFLAQSICKVFKGETTYVCCSFGNYFFRDKYGCFFLCKHYEENH